MGSNAEPVRSLEVAESKVVAGDSGIEKKLSMKSQQKAVSQKEVAVGRLVDASVSRNAELVRETGWRSQREELEIVFKRN